jgi:SpoVK/Ycf46/Vps4 family AAA+-type ATPase
MATSDQIKALIKSHSEGDDSRFYSIAMQVAAQAAKQGHSKLADELKHLIDDAKEKGHLLKVRDTPNTVFIGQPRGELSSILSVSYPDDGLNSLILPSGTLERLDRVIREHKMQDKLRSKGLQPRRKLLLVGPPGSGKTLTASALAGEMDLPLYTIQLDGLITRYMGETAAKLRLVFENIQKIRGVYLFDEFDAIGGQRSFANDVGEIRRVLNSFLQFLEQSSAESLIIAATNHPELLDSALFRRFDDVLEYDLPSNGLALKLFKDRLSLMDTKKVDWKKIVTESQDLSFAEITRVCEETVKESVLSDVESVSTENLVAHIRDRKLSKK